MNTYLMIDAREIGPVDLGDRTLEIWAISQPSPDRPDRNEDAAGAWLIPGVGAVLAVADGMGGTPQGARCAAIAIQCLDRALAHVDHGRDLRTVVLDAIEDANRAIREHAAGSGTTLVAAQLSEGCVRTYNVGDSAAFLVGQRGRLKIETIAHSPVGYGVAAGLIDPDAAANHEDSHYLSNHLGSDSLHIEVGSDFSMAPRDTLVLASDGLLDNMAPSELIDTVRCGPLRAAAEALARRAVARMALDDDQSGGKRDDLTFLLLRRRSR